MSTRSHSVYIYMLVAKGTTSLKGSSPHVLVTLANYWQRAVEDGGTFSNFLILWINFNVVN